MPIMTWHTHTRTHTKGEYICIYILITRNLTSNNRPSHRFQDDNPAFNYTATGSQTLLTSINTGISVMILAEYCAGMGPACTGRYLRRLRSLDAPELVAASTDYRAGLYRVSQRDKSTTLESHCPHQESFNYALISEQPYLISLFWLFPTGMSVLKHIVSYKSPEAWSSDLACPAPPVLWPPSRDVFSHHDHTTPV